MEKYINSCGHLEVAPTHEINSTLRLACWDLQEALGLVCGEDTTPAFMPPWQNVDALESAVDQAKSAIAKLELAIAALRAD